eukprot:scaffold6081_cov101-Cylindrotheca_fusiformis.AAC.3
MGILGKIQSSITRMSFGKEKKLPPGTDFLSLKDTLIDGTEVTMSDFKGDVLCVVNGFKVLAFPCNQFLKQEPGTPEEILSFVKDNYGLKDRMIFFSKKDVNGANARPVFTFLKHELPFKDGTTNIQWNFGKFLIDHEGKPYKRFGSKTNPDEMKADLEALLAKRNGAK